MPPKAKPPPKKPANQPPPSGNGNFGTVRPGQPAFGATRNTPGFGAPGPARPAFTGADLKKLKNELKEKHLKVEKNIKKNHKRTKKRRR
jgi:hypothetical protein